MPDVDVQEKINEVVGLVQAARAMPMSASAMVNRNELLAHLEELRALLPADLERARELLRDRDGVIDGGRDEAEAIIEAARAEQRRLVGRTEIVREAQAEAARIVAAARTEVLAIRAEVDDYVDAKLANFEVVLQKTLRAVERGRSKLRGDPEPLLSDGEELRALPG